MYFSRVARIFQDAEVSKQEFERMIAGTGMISTRAGNTGSSLPTTDIARLEVFHRLQQNFTIEMNPRIEIIS
jgi:hypothetical protein